MSIKAQRVASELIKEIASIIVDESTDDSFRNVSITEAEVSDDLSYAKVYFICYDSSKKEEVEKDLNEAENFFRKFLAQRLDIRQIPNLKFIYDDTIDYAENIEKIIDRINKE